MPCSQVADAAFPAIRTTGADSKENALDFTFLNLGIDSAVEQPIVMTERLANPLFSRASESALTTFGA
jgi:hypothetical protein